MKKKIAFVVGFFVVAVALIVAFTSKQEITAKDKDTVEGVNHKITYEQVLEMRGAYKGSMEQSSFEIEQVRELVNQPNAKWLGFSPGHHDGKDVPILTIYDANKNELQNFALELSSGCPPYCWGKVARKGK